MNQDQENILLTLDGESFLFTTDRLTREQRINLEVAVDLFEDEFSEALPFMRPHEKCSHFCDLALDRYDIELTSAPIGLELSNRGRGARSHHGRER